MNLKKMGMIIRVVMIVAFACISRQMVARPFTIMIDPAGDARNTGRQLQDSFERGISLQCAQRIAQELESRYRGIKVILTRMPGETVQELQNANFANRMTIDLYISIHFFQETETLPRWYLYTYRQMDDHLSKPIELSFYRYDQAHLFHEKMSKQVGALFQQTLVSSSYAKQFQYQPCVSLPFKPLVGIKVPAIACEIGLKNKESWLMCIEPFLVAFDSVLQQLF